MRIFRSIQAWASVALVVLGTMVMTGWLLRNAALVQIRPDSGAMVFNMALGFALLGVALFLPLIRIPSTTKIQAAIGWVLIAIASLTLVEYLVDRSLLIDLPAIHSWLNDGNPHPGRGALGACLGFMLSGFTLLMMQRVRSKADGIAIIVATSAVLMWGLLTLASYSLHLDLLYPWFPKVRMPVHTGAGMIVSGIGLWSSWREAAWYRSQHYFNDDEKIGLVAISILTAIALTAGVIGFAVQLATLERTLTENLRSQLKHQTTLFQTTVRQSVGRVENAATHLDLIRLVRQSARASEPSGAAAEFDAVVQNLFAEGFGGIAIYDRSNRNLLRRGRFHNEPKITTDLGLATLASLRWEGVLYLNTRANILDNGRIIGTLEVEQPLHLITEQFSIGEGFGASGEMGMCIRQQDQLRCFPQRRNPVVYTAPRLSANGVPTAMSYAVDGQSGIFKGLDYRGHQVIAAYGPLTSAGLGIVVKQDADELYQPIREQLQWYLPLLLLLVAGGALLLRAQVKPLVSKLFQSEARSREITETLGEGVIVSDQQGMILFSNPAAQQLLGWTEQELRGKIGHTLFHHSHPDGTPYPARLCEIGIAARAGRSFRSPDEVYWRKDGSMLPVSINSAPIRRDGRVVGAVMAFHDIIERKKAQQALAAESAKNAMLLRTASDGIHVLDASGNVVLANDAFCRMLGYEPESMQGMNVAQWEAQLSGAALQARLAQLLDRDELFETRHRRRDGSILDVEIHVAGVVIDGQRLLYASARDISERKRVALQMQHLAHFDILTDLPNRTLLNDRLRQALAKAKRDRAPMALLFIDLDQFKPVNDTFGHDIGDLLLKEVAMRLQDCLRDSDTAARVGGDEFVVLLPAVTQKTDALTVAQKILQALTQPFELEGHALHIAASIGVAVYPEHGSDEEQLLKSADDAMYQVKKQGGAATFVSTTARCAPP